jgi:hypothetical protein
MTNNVTNSHPDVSVTICTPGYGVYPMVDVLTDSKTALLKASSSNEKVSSPQVDPIWLRP